MQGLLIPPLFEAPFVSSKITGTKVKVTLFGTCFISGLGLIFSATLSKWHQIRQGFGKVPEKVPFLTKYGVLGGYIFNLQLI